MTAADLLDNLEQIGVRIEVQGERLRFFPVERVSNELKAEMKALKSELLKLLQKPGETPIDDEIRWRVTAMQNQIRNHQGAYFPTLTARDGITTRKGYCFSCGEKLSQFEGLYSCNLCIQAMHTALGLG